MLSCLEILLVAEVINALETEMHVCMAYILTTTKVAAKHRYLSDC